MEKVADGAHPEDVAAALGCTARPSTGLYFGEGRPFHAEGIPTISYLTGPSYLFASPRGGEITKVNLTKMYGEIVASRAASRLSTP